MTRSRFPGSFVRTWRRHPRTVDLIRGGDVRISAAVATVLLSAVPVTASASGRAITPFDLYDDGSMVVSVTIGGTGPYRFVIDTGSSRTAISTRLWQTLRLPVLSQTVLITPAGRDIAHVVRMDGVVISGGPAGNLRAAVLPANRDVTGPKIDGLIGQDLLATAVYTIDYLERTVVWHDAGDSLSGLRLPMLMRDNRLLVSLAQRDGDPSPLRLIPDSGSDGLVFFSHAQDKLRVRPLNVGVLSGASGAPRLVRQVEVEGMVVGDTRIDKALAVLLESRDPAQMMGDGLLPLHLFARVTFNAGEGYLIVEPR
jgi:hypothetical protein